jgi:hypothetical protein
MVAPSSAYNNANASGTGSKVSLNIPKKDSDCLREEQIAKNRRMGKCENLWMTI